MNIPLSKLCIRYRDKGICQLCMQEFGPKSRILNIDHIVPQSMFAFSHPFNLQVLCKECNLEKYNDMEYVYPNMFVNAYERSINQWSEKNIELIYSVLKCHYRDNQNKWYQIEKKWNEKLVGSIKTIFHSKEYQIIESLLGSFVETNETMKELRLMRHPTNASYYERFKRRVRIPRDNLLSEVVVNMVMQFIDEKE